MDIITKIEKDYLEAYKTRDNRKVSALRLLKSALKNLSIEKKRELSDDEAITIVQHEIKQRNDSIVEFDRAKRTELAEIERAEISILSRYLPEQLSEDALRSIIIEATKNLGAHTQAETGKVIGFVMSKVKGRADGSLVAKIVIDTLGK